MTDTEHVSTESDSGPRRGLLRWGAAGVSALIVGIVGLFVVLQTIVDAEYLETRVNAHLADATSGRYRAEIDAARLGLFATSLHVQGVKVFPDSPEGDSSGRKVTPGSPRYRGAVSTIRLEGIHLWSLLVERVLTVETLALQRPRVRIRSPEHSGKGSSADRVEAQSDTAVGEASPAPFPEVNVHRVRLRDGTLTTKRGTGPPQDSLWGLTVALDSLSTWSGRFENPLPRLAEGFVRGTFDGYRRRFPDDSYALRIGSGRASARDSTFAVNTLRYGPSVSDREFLRRREYRANRYRVAARRIEGRDVDYRQFVNDGVIDVTALAIDSLQLDVYRDNHLPSPPKDPPPPMPHEMVESYAHPFSIDTVRVRRSHIRYVKRPEQVPEAGSIAFEDLWATVYNVTNRPERMTPSTPPVVDARTEVAGAGQLRTTLRLPLLAPALTFSFQGHLGTLDATALNETFVNLGGVRIESGTVDSLWFEATVERGTARGTLGSVYRDLEIETLDRATGARGLKNRLKTFLVNGLALRSDNRPGEDFHAGEIEHRHQADHSFFKFLWLSLRSGIYSLVGIDRLPR